MLNFVKKMVDGFPIGANETQVGVITFDSKVYLQFHLNKYHTKTDIKNAVSKTRYLPIFCKIYIYSVHTLDLFLKMNMIWCLVVIEL